MRAPMVILALLCVCGGWIGIDSFSAYLAPAAAAHRPMPTGNPGLEFILSIAAVLVALEGWLIADKYYRRKPKRPAQFAAALPTGYKLLANKYYVDEIYGAVIVKPLLSVSNYVLGWIVDTAILGGLAWLLAGVANFTGMILQRWQSGNLRSYAAWLAAAAAAVLLFVLLSRGWPYMNFAIAWRGWSLR
jgi:NADH-quinone oxidoreductase subunit L